MSRTLENAEFVAFCSRLVRRAGRRVADSDPDDLVLLLRLQSDLDDSLRVAVQGLYSQGYSWGLIAKQLGVSRQYVHRMFSGGADDSRSVG